MRFVIIRKADAQTEAGAVPGPELIRAMMAYNEELVAAGAMVDGAGLKPSARGARIRFKRGKPVVTDGPFAETKELVAGFTMIDVASYEEALAWARRWPCLDADGAVELEVRQVYEAEDFTQGLTPEQQAETHRAFDAVSKRG